MQKLQARRELSELELPPQKKYRPDTTRTECAAHRRKGTSVIKSHEYSQVSTEITNFFSKEAQDNSTIHKKDPILPENTANLRKDNCTLPEDNSKLTRKRVTYPPESLKLPLKSVIFDLVTVFCGVKGFKMAKKTKAQLEKDNEELRNNVQECLQLLEQQGRELNLSLIHI